MSTTLQKKNKREGGKEEEETGEVKYPVVQTEDTTPVGSSKATDVKPKNPPGGKKKEQVILEKFEEEDKKKRVEETTRKRKSGGCINLQEVAEFQRFVSEKMAKLVEEMWNTKNLIQPVRELIRSLKLQYDKIHLFENNGALNTEWEVLMWFDSEVAARASGVAETVDYFG